MLLYATKMGSAGKDLRGFGGGVGWGDPGVGRGETAVDWGCGTATDSPNAGAWGRSITTPPAAAVTAVAPITRRLTLRSAIPVTPPVYPAPTSLDSGGGP